MKKEKHIQFTPHAEEKLKRLVKLQVTKEKIIKAIEKPESLTAGYFGRKIAQSKLKHGPVLRVVYEEIDNKVLVITIYPAKRERYI
ncbi:MAG: DUF4258 domain-containing protein [Candidatus Bathyarchaeota archaeon]|jgi:Txe/YoeB family toxin of Txe-Axe toxin-antitoxin module|nr:DUF4258 domain-containing protein [Candidatus Bathyarchaeota archaeon]